MNLLIIKKGKYKKMNKPFSLVYKEFKNELANLINNSGLNPFIIESVLQNYLYEINSVASNQYEADKAQFEKSLLEKDEKEQN